MRPGPGASPEGAEASPIESLERPERPEVERALLEREQDVALSGAVSTAMAMGGDLREILQRCAQALVDHLGAAFARVWTLNDAEQMLELEASAGLYTHLDGAHGRVPVGAYKIGKIAAERAPHLTNDVPNDPRVSDKDWARREGMVAFAGHPLLVDERVVGVVAMFAREPLSDGTLASLRGLADRLGLVVERERTNRELRRREHQLAEAQAMAQLGSWEWRVGTDAIVWSEELHRIFGVPAGPTVTYDQYMERIHPEDRERVGSTVRSAMERLETYQLEHRIVRPDGSVRHILSQGEVEADRQGRPLRLFGVAQDVTERREAAAREQELALEQLARSEAEAAERRITRILESITDAFFGLDAGWRFSYVNREAERLLDRPAGELIGRSIWDEFPEFVGSTFDEMYRKAVAERQTVQFREFYPPLSAWFEVRAFPAEDGLSVYFRDVTEQQRAERALRKSEERFRSLIEATSAIVWTTSVSGELAGEQPQWAEFTGMAPEEYRGWGWLDAVHPGDRESVEAAWRRALETRALFEAEHRLRRHDGQYRHMAARGVPVLEPDGSVREWVGVHADVSTRKQLEDRQAFLVQAGAILGSSLEYETTLRSVAQLAVPDLADWCAIDLAEESGEVRRVEVAHSDPAKRRMVAEIERKYPADPDAPAGVHQVMRTGAPQLIPEIPESLLEESARDAEHLRLIRSLGLRSLMVVPLIARSRTLGAVTLASSESGRIYGEEDLEFARELAMRAAMAVDNARLFRDLERVLREVEARAEELRSLAEALERSNRELDQFAYVTSHDLKAPLRGIANLAQWIEEDLGEGVPAETKEHLQLMRGRVERMDGLIDGILEFSRAGRVQESIRDVDVGALLAEVVDMASPPERVDIVIEAGMPTLRTERLPLQQVFMNLIGNAIKYNDREDARIVVSARPAGGGLHEFAVADNGPGIAPEYHSRIFGIFQTLHARDQVEGTGIGLSLVQKIVETRGGKVWVESEVGEGATFRFLWPERSAGEGDEE